MTTIHNINGITWKYKRDKMCNQFNTVKSNKYQWFMWRLVNGEWEYMGYSSTKSKLIEFISGRYDSE